MDARIEFFWICLIASQGHDTLILYNTPFETLRFLAKGKFNTVCRLYNFQDTANSEVAAKNHSHGSEKYSITV